MKSLVSEFRDSASIVRDWGGTGKYAVFVHGFCGESFSVEGFTSYEDATRAYDLVTLILAIIAGDLDA